jgi:hypothetical protein
VTRPSYKCRSLEERMAMQTAAGGSNECHLWIGTTVGHGHGQVRRPGGKRDMAHRVAWEMVNGPVPPGMWVLHKCDNPPCVNPAHLYIGNHADNTRDMVARGRAAGRPGSTHPSHKLVESQVLDIRAKRADGVSVRELIAQYGVSEMSIRKIEWRRTWRHI